MVVSGSIASGQKPLKLSLAEWSLHRALNNGEITNLDFPKIAKTKYNLDAVEYVSTFFKGKGDDQTYLQNLKNECKKYGVKSLLIMIDGEGPLADTSEAVRNKTVENHHKWVKAAKFLGCHSIRVNVQGQGTMEQVKKAAIDGLSKLCDYAAKDKINVIVENHGGYSSNGKWLSEVIKAVNKPNCGTLPDFGNFYEYDRYQGTQDMMPFAKGVSGKSYDFDAQGNETKIDYARMIKIVKDSGYKGYIDIEYEGTRLTEDEGIKATQMLLERLIAQK
ncbi:MAG: sugar phosphate isomerase/epimerase family protein [Bacteroidota bacterium]|nr:sugar phosphate isomerase/epimerase family protein [Bacteroidota bacterium]